jgi:riboflavin biosynthesis pyrimidine reductase
MADAPTLEVLLPAGHAPIGPLDDDRLAEHYSEAELPWVRANMISTLDGAATGADGRSGSINGPADHRAFEALRAWADVILVGAGTVRSEGYRAPRTPEHLVQARRDRGQRDHPALAIVTGGGDLPGAVLADDPAPWVVTTTDAPGLAELRRRLPPGRLLVHEEAVDLAATIDALVDASLPRILTEGGPTLLGALLAAHLVDELCLTWSPRVVAGPAPRPVVAPAWLAPPAEARLGGLLHCEGVLLGRWLLSR